MIIIGGARLYVFITHIMQMILSKRLERWLLLLFFIVTVPSAIIVIIGEFAQFCMPFTNLNTIKTTSGPSLTLNAFV